MTVIPTEPTPPAKRPYVTPALVVHGDVQTLTQASILLDVDGPGVSTLGVPQG